jgi:hypothetical protein
MKGLSRENISPMLAASDFSGSQPRLILPLDAAIRRCAVRFIDHFRARSFLRPAFSLRWLVIAWMPTDCSI